MSHSNPTWIELKQKLTKTNKKINTPNEQKIYNPLCTNERLILLATVKENRLKLECV